MGCRSAYHSVTTRKCLDASVFFCLGRKNGIWFTEFANGCNVDTDVPAYLKLGKKSCASISTLVETEVYGLKV